MLKARHHPLSYLLLLFAAWATLITWAGTHVISDRFGPTQWLAWIPPEPLLAGAALTLLMASGLARTRRRKGLNKGLSKGLKKGLKENGHRVRQGALIALLLSLTFVLLIDWRVYRFAIRAPRAPDAMRIVNWNASVMSMPDFETLMLDQHPDLLIVSNPPLRAPWSEMMAAMSAEAVRAATFTVLSRHRVVRWGTCALGLNGRMYVSPKARSDRVDHGRALFVELDTSSQLGKPIIVWVLDLPSDPKLPRMRMVDDVRARLNSWTGQEHLRDADGAETLRSGTGFPEPDMIIGDLNIPRGSASLTRLAGGMTNAYDQCGVGRIATWPRPVPFLHLDQAFVRAPLRATSYTVADPGVGLHLMQIIEIAAPASGESGSSNQK